LKLQNRLSRLEDRRASGHQPIIDRAAIEQAALAGLSETEIRAVDSNPAAWAEKFIQAQQQAGSWLVIKNAADWNL